MPPVRITPDHEDYDRSNQYFNQHDYDDGDMRRDTRREYEYDRPSRYDQRDPRYDERYDRSSRKLNRYRSPRPKYWSSQRDYDSRQNESVHSDRRSDWGYENHRSPERRYADL